MNDREVLSVLVLTYNSSTTIVETLESVLKQSYGSKNIQLVISDDCSADNTLDVIDVWLRLYANSFYSVELNALSRNVGIPSNLNSGLRKCNAKWIKLIAGDDLLTTDCLDVNAEYITENPNCQIVFSKLQSFNQKGIIKEYLPQEKDICFFKLSASEQKKKLLLRNFSCLAPTVFLNKDLVERIGGADERYNLIEDLPLWIKVTESGFPLCFLNKVTVFYRREETVMHSNINFINRSFIECRMRMQEEFINPRLEGNLIYKLDKILYFRSLLITSYITNNKKNIYSKGIMMFLNMFRPYFYLDRLR